MTPKHIFIVGLPRTGTKLMVNILQATPGHHSLLAPENFFLGRAFLPGAWQQMQRYGDLQVDANVYRLVDAMYSGVFYGEYWDRLQGGGWGASRTVMLQTLLAGDRSPQAIYTALLQAVAAGNDVGNDQTILGDKTGPHLYHVPTLLRWFPEARIIHTFRDPRAILASEHKKRTAQWQRRRAKAHSMRAFAMRLLQPLVSLLIVLYITTAWLRAARLHYRYKQRYPQNYYLAKFEDLVNQPVTQVSALCHFLGLPFDPAMLHPPTVDSSFERTDETGFDPAVLTRWQGALQPWMKGWLHLWAGRVLKKFGYAG